MTKYVRNPQDNDTDYNMGIIVSVPGERVPRKRYPQKGAHPFASSIGLSLDGVVIGMY